VRRRVSGTACAPCEAAGSGRPRRFAGTDSHAATRCQGRYRVRYQRGRLHVQDAACRGRPHRPGVDDGHVDVVSAQVPRQCGARRVQRRLAHTVAILPQPQPPSLIAWPCAAHPTSWKTATLNSSGPHTPCCFQPWPRACRGCSADTKWRFPTHMHPCILTGAKYWSATTRRPSLRPAEGASRTSPPPVRPSPMDPILLPSSTICAAKSAIMADLN